MKQTIYFVDAFAEKIFEGNPAGVCILDTPIEESLMQLIAAENNLSETAFIVKENNRFSIRWFTPTVEVDLCGHATLASAYILFNEFNYQGNLIEFDSRSGLLSVKKEGDFLTLNFPTGELTRIEVPDNVLQVFGKTPCEVYKTNGDLMFVFENENDIINMQPDITVLARYDCRGVIVTSKSSEYDFISRFFAPQSGINEDPVTGSAHTNLTVYWSRTLGKKELKAKQVSQRSGKLLCRYLGDRVEISGKAVLYMKGEIELRGY